MRRHRKPSRVWRKRDTALAALFLLLAPIVGFACALLGLQALP